MKKNKDNYYQTIFSLSLLMQKVKAQYNNFNVPLETDELLDNLRLAKGELEKAQNIYKSILEEK